MRPAAAPHDQTRFTAPSTTPAAFTHEGITLTIPAGVVFEDALHAILALRRQYIMSITGAK